MKIGPKAIQNHEKMILESEEIQFLRKLIFATLSMPNACFCKPRHPNLDPKTNRKSKLEIDMKKLFLLSKSTKKTLRMGPQNQQKIDKIQAWTSQGPSLCPPMSQDRPRIVPGSSQGPPGRQSRGTKHAK